jgi:acetyltransferase-like isoleucine patch superfamily enzyme
MKTTVLIKKVLSVVIFYLLGGVRSARFLGVDVGERCRIYTLNFGSEPFLIKIGNRVTLTSGVKILTHDGAAWLMRDIKGRRFKYQKVIIGNNVFVGVNSIIMPGVIIEENIIVAAGSVVTKSIPSGSIVAGNPAKIIGKFDDLKNKALFEFVSENELEMTLPYKERVLAALTQTSKNFMSNNE